MPERVIFVWLSVLALVTSNPVPQVLTNQQYANQQTLFIPSSSIPSSCQVKANQNIPCEHYVTKENQAPIQRNPDGSTINDLLINKILGNSCLQKILDPNTKLYNQNGHEIKRQPNTAATPSVVNNYFIVPPEFFNINGNKTENKSKNLLERRKIANKRAKSNKNTKKLSDPEDVNKYNSFNDVERNKNKKTTGRTKSKKITRNKTHKIAKDNVETNNEQSAKDSQSEIKITKKRKKQEFSSKHPLIETKIPNNSTKNNNNEPIVDHTSIQNNKDKKPKKHKKKPKVVETEANDKVDTVSETIFIQENVNPRSESANNVLRAFPGVENGAHLKNLELPIDNSEALSIDENIRPIKHVNENRKTRNPNLDNAKKELKEMGKSKPRNTPMSEDMLRNYHPFMYMGLNNFFSNGNYPYNFEQFYQPFLGDKNDKKYKTRKTLNEQNKQKSQSKVIEVKLKPKKHENTNSRMTPEKNKDKIILEAMNTTTVTNVLDENNTNDLNLESINMIPSSEAPERVTEIKIKNLTDENLPKQIKENIPKVSLQLDEQNKESPATKTNLEKPPTFIEDLHEYITPELGSEDIMPTIHNNGIINDYFPIFYDNSQYSDDESYYLRDLEDNRPFYTTDRGFEEPINRDRSKFDLYENRPNNNIKDRINFRRTYKVRERDKSRFISDGKGSIRRLNSDKVTQEEDEIINTNTETGESKQNGNKENQFQTPPLLEKPDFITKKIENAVPESEIINYEVQGPVYTELIENIPLQRHFEPTPIQYSRLLNFDDDVKENDQDTMKAKPKNDKIETVFAKTRVVKYGVAKDEEHTSSLPLFENDGEELYSDGHTTYVLAKSLNSDDYYW